MGKFSKEFLFRECVLHRHCILLRLSEPIQWDDNAVDEIFMVDMCLREKEKEHLLLNMANTINNYGMIKIKAFAIQEEPQNARVFTLSTSDIVEIELLNH